MKMNDKTSSSESFAQSDKSNNANDISRIPPECHSPANPKSSVSKSQDRNNNGRIGKQTNKFVVKLLKDFIRRFVQGSTYGVGLYAGVRLVSALLRNPFRETSVHFICVCLPACMPACLSIFLPVPLHVCLSLCRPDVLPACPSACLSPCLFAYHRDCVPDCTCVRCPLVC